MNPKSISQCQHYQTLMTDFKRHYGFTEHEFFCCKLLNHTLVNQLFLDDRENQLLNSFIAHSLGNMALNKILHQAITHFPVLVAAQSFSPATIQIIFALTFSPRHWEKISILILGNDTLTMEDFSIMRDLASLVPVLEKLKKLAIFNHNENFKRLDEIASECERTVNRIESQILLASAKKGLYAPAELTLIAYFAQLKEILLRTNFIRPTP